MGTVHDSLNELVSLLDDGGNFVLDVDDPPRYAMRKLKKLRGRSSECRHSTLQFCIRPGAPLTSDVTASIVKTIQHCSSQGVRWDGLVFQEPFDQANELHQKILKHACQYELFSFIWLNLLYGAGDDVVETMNEETACSLRDSMLKNSAMEKISFLGVRLTVEATRILGEGLRHAKSLKTLSLRLRESSEGGAFELPDCFVQALEENDTLETLELDGVPENWMERVMGGLTNHPALQQLNLKKCTWNEASLRHLAYLLESTKCRLEMLDMSYPNIHPDSRMNMPMFASCLEASKSLQKIRLKLADLNDSELCFLLRSVAKCPYLTDIDLTHNNICSLDWYSVHDYEATQLRRICFDGNPILNEASCEQSFARLLEGNPYLTVLGERFSKSARCSQSLHRWLDMNRCGRALLQHSAVPISLWPIVLERGNRLLQTTPHRQAAVVYEFVHALSTHQLFG